MAAAPENLNSKGVQTTEFPSAYSRVFWNKTSQFKSCDYRIGRVAHGLLEVMNLMGIIEIEPEEYLSSEIFRILYSPS